MSWVFNRKPMGSDTRHLTRALRVMRPAAPPPGLSTSLRVLASRERRRQAEHRGWQARWEAWGTWARLTARNLMRPLALPVAGGVFSAVTLFSAWVAPAYPVSAAQAEGVDVPISLTTAAAVKGTMPIGLTTEDVVVDIEINEQGRMVDYTIVSGAYLLTATARRNLENQLVFTEFVPATAFGKPRSAHMRIRFNSSMIEVRG